ncbi:MAG: FeoA family protein [Planctomycetota bacterium]|jgi:ferrous iron transport protein A
MDTIPLELLRRGEQADVTEVHGEPCWVGRMAELGIRTGCRLRVLQPGAPCVLMVGEARLTLRGDSVFQILVRPVAG